MACLFYQAMILLPLSITSPSIFKIPSFSNRRKDPDMAGSCAGLLQAKEPADRLANRADFPEDAAVGNGIGSHAGKFDNPKIQQVKRPSIGAELDVYKPF